MFDYLTKRNNLKIEIYFKNKTNFNITNFSVEYQGNDSKINFSFYIILFF